MSCAALAGEKLAAKQPRVANINAEDAVFSSFRQDFTVLLLLETPQSGFILAEI
jgi:hypothetical protein